MGFAVTLWTRVQGWLAAAAVALAAIGAALAYGMRAGRRRAEHDQVQRRVEAAGERARADADAGRAADPAGELRRDWMRGVASDPDRAR